MLLMGHGKKLMVNTEKIEVFQRFKMSGKEQQACFFSFVQRNILRLFTVLIQSEKENHVFINVVTSSKAICVM